MSCKSIIKYKLYGIVDSSKYITFIKNSANLLLFLMLSL